ncbi:MAG TPA: YkgJ family cysteine cluster protein [Ferruginibacter sp.]|nr:YkgJ family cysteine cluster protein [Ferruginibacter sp.]
MAQLPYSFDPQPGYHSYKVTSTLKDYLALLMASPEDQETISRILKMIDDYVVQLKELRTKDLPETTRQVHGAIDGFFEKTPEEEKKEVRCRSGCTACCYIDVDVSGDEAALIVEHCIANGIEIDKSYLVEQAAAGRSTYSPLSRCVFLKDNLCTIYSVRPIACRKHWVKTDPALCDFSSNELNQVGSVFNVNAEILASAMLNVNEVMPFEQALLKQLEQ